MRYLIVTLVSPHLIRDIHLEIESKVVERGPCQVVRLVRVVQLVKSRNSLETLTISEQSCREAGWGLSKGTTRASRETGETNLASH